MSTLLPLLLAAALGVPTPLPAPAAPALGRPALAADTLRGRVTDAEGAPVEGADVQIPELQRATRTAGDGSFAFASIPAGSYSLMVRRPGYATEVRRVSAGGSAPVQVALQTTPFLVPAVTVTATRAPIQTLRSPLSVSAVGDEQLRRHSEVSLAHTIQELPGVRTLSTGEQIGKPVIRGLTGSRVLVLDAGNRLEDYSWSDEDAPSIDARLADRVEVIRGPASLLYGPDAEGGVVNVIPEEVPDATGGASFLRTAVEAWGASNNRETGANLRLEGARAGIGYRLSGIGRFADDLHTPAGPLDNTGFWSANGEAALGKKGSWGSATLRYARYGGEFRLLEANGPASSPPAQSGAGEEGPVRKLADDRIQFDGSLPVAGGAGLTIETRAQYQRHWLAEVSDEGGAASGTGGEQTAFDLTLNTLSGDLLAHHSLRPNVTGTAGLSGFVQAHDSRGPVTLVPSAHGAAGGAFLFEQATLGRLTLSGGVRGDVRSISADANAALATPADQRSWSAFSGDAGAVYELLDGVALRANVGRAWRAPTLFELYANGPLPSDARFEIGDANLDAEHSTTTDVGVRVERGEVRAELSAFRNVMGDYIFIEPTGAFRDSLRVFQYAQAPALLWGFDGGLDVEATAWLDLRAEGDWVRGQNRELDQPLPLMPPPRARFEAELKTANRSWAQRAWAMAGTDLVARQTRLAPYDVPTAAYALLNLGAGLERRVGGRPTRVDLRVSNALNASYRDYLSRYKEFALNPGRSVSLRLGTEF